jgi:hypothetical protein
MKKNKQESKNKPKQAQPRVKPEHPDMTGAPNDRDPHAQYEDKDES